MLNPQLHGHGPIRRRLLERLEAGRLSGSLLLVGPEGIGKRRVAFELAQRELCFRRSACGLCEGCRLFQSDPPPVELPNLLRIAPEGKAGLIRIGVIREDDLVEGGVIRWAHQAPPPRCHRWIVVEDAHRLHGASANMLLKTLEEPPPGTHFLLVTHRPEAMLQTIRSRCERVAFSPLTPEVAWGIAREAGWGAEQEARWKALSGGTLRLMDPATFELACAQVEAWLGVLQGRSGDMVPLLPDRSSGKSQAEQLGQALDLLQRVLGDLARCAAGREPELLPWRTSLQTISQRSPDLKGLQDAALRLQRHLPRNPSAQLALQEVLAAV